MKKISTLLFISLIFILGCNKDNQSGKMIYTSISDSYPLHIGYHWEYYTEIHIDSTVSHKWNSYYRNIWKVLSDTVINGINCTKVSQEDSNYNGTSYKCNAFYANKLDGLYGIAIQNYGSILYLKKLNIIINYKIPAFIYSFPKNTLNSDSIFVLQNPLFLLKFPIVSNDWWYSNEWGPESKTKRQWLNDTTILTNIGIFQCKKLQVLLYDNTNGVYTPDPIHIVQYFNSKGLILEKVFGKLLFNDGTTGYLNETTNLVEVNF